MSASGSLHVISLGAGVQSSVMLLMAATGELEPFPAAAIFADTQWEPRRVYGHLAWLESEVVRLTDGKLPIYRVTAGDIRSGVLSAKRRFTPMPLFTASGGMGRRQCTRQYKIAPIKKKVREILGVAPRHRVPKGQTITQWMGITVDEVTRMKPSRDAWWLNRYPLVEKHMTRADCLSWFARAYPGRELARSACVACPYRSDAEWRDLRDNEPESWREAVEFDRAIRKGGSDSCFVHVSRVPLDEVDLSTAEERGQMTLWSNECEGMCGV